MSTAAPGSPTPQNPITEPPTNGRALNRSVEVGKPEKKGQGIAKEIVDETLEKMK